MDNTSDQTANQTTNNTANGTMNQLRKIPVLGALVSAYEARPRIVAWIVLSVGIIALLLVEARDVGLMATQWLALAVAAVLVSGLCVWIVTFGDDDDQDATDETPAS